MVSKMFQILDFLSRSRISLASHTFILILFPLFFGVLDAKMILWLIAIFFVNYHIVLYNDYCDQKEDMVVKKNHG